MKKGYLEELGNREDILVYPIDPKSIRSFEFIRGYCERNTCGQYNKNWMCPPNLPDVQELNENLKQFDQAYLVQKSYRELDPLGGELSMKKDFFNEMSKINVALDEKEHLVLSAGECNFCEVCKKVFNEPCVNSDMALASLESYGIEVNNLMKSNNLKKRKMPEEKCLIGLVCLND